MASFEKKYKDWEWSDLIKWLTGLKQLIEKFNSPISDEQIVVISKRLSQCLYPSLPHGLHSKTLELYNIIISKQPSTKHIFILSFGLFQHFQYCAPQNKVQFLSLISENFINKPDLTLLTSGLVACLLTGAGDKQEILNKVLEMLDSFQETAILHTAVWKFILKSRKFKNIGLVFMQKRMHLYECRELVINSLLEALDDSSVINRRLALDIIKNYFPIVEKTQDITVLMYAVLKLITGKDHSLIRRLWEWAFPEEIHQKQINLVKDVMKDAVVLIFRENHERIGTEPEHANEIKISSLKIVEELILNEGIGDEFVSDIAIPLINHSISDQLVNIKGPHTNKLINLFNTYSELFWEAVTTYLDNNILENEEDSLQIASFAIKYFQISEFYHTKLLTTLTLSLHKLKNFFFSLSICKLLLESLPNPPPLKLRHTRKKLSSLLKEKEESLLLDYTYLISKCNPDPQSISEIITYLKLASGKNLFLSLKVIINFSEKSLTDEDFQTLWRRVPSQNAELLEILVNSYTHLRNQWISGLASLLLSLSRDLHIRSFIVFWEYASKFHEGTLLEITRSGEIVFILIDHLNDNSPTVRHAARAWLNVAIKLLPCLIDPILSIILNPSTARVDLNGDSVYLYDFDCNRVQDVLGKLSLLLLFENSLGLSLQSLKLSAYAQELAIFHTIDPTNYLEVLLEVALRFIGTGGTRHQTEVSRVQSSACEVLRLLSTNIAAGYSNALLEKVGTIMYRVLGTSLESSLISVMQQLCNLQSEFVYPSRAADVLILGLRSEDYYLRDQWGKVINLALPCMLASSLSPAICNYITVLLINYCDVIHQFKDQTLLTGLRKLIGSALRLGKSIKPSKFKVLKATVFNELERIFVLAMNFSGNDEIAKTLAEMSELFPIETSAGLVDLWHKHLHSPSLQDFQRVIPRLGLSSAHIFEGISVAIEVRKYNEIVIGNLMYTVVEKMGHMMGNESNWVKVISVLKLLEHGKWDEACAWIIKVVHILLSINLPSGKNLRDLQRIIENIVVKCQESILKWEKVASSEFTKLPGTTVLEVILDSLIYSISMFRLIWRSSQSKLIRIISDFAKALLDAITLVDRSGESITKMLSTLLISFPLIFDSIKTPLVDVIKTKIFEILEKFPKSIEYWYDIINTIPKQSVMQMLDVYDVMFWKSAEYKTKMLTQSLGLISLILLSGEKDAYISSLQFISKRLDELFALNKISDRLFSMMYLLLQVLSARITDFKEIWVKCWPELYISLMKNLQVAVIPISYNAARFIDMMLVTYPEFCDYIWMYLYDIPEIELLPGNCYGEYKPAVSLFLKGFSARPCNVRREENISEKVTRGVLLIENCVESIEELEKYIKTLIQYTMFYSTERFEVEWESVEQSLRNQVVGIQSLIISEVV